MRIGITCYPTHGEAGYRFPVGDVEQMAKAGAELLPDEASRRRFSEAAQTVPRERFAAEKVMRRCEAHCCDVVEGRG